MSVNTKKFALPIFYLSGIFYYFRMPQYYRNKENKIWCSKKCGLCSTASRPWRPVPQGLFFDISFDAEKGLFRHRVAKNILSLS